MSRTSKILVALALALLLTGCSSAAAEVSYAPPESERLTVYTSHKEEVYSPIIREFEERTGIWVEVVTGGTNELLDRLAREADSPAADVMFGGGVESLEHYGELFTPYLSSEAENIDPQYLPDDRLWTPFSALPIVLIYNTKLVPAGQLTRWSDLLAPSSLYTGRIAFADPEISGSSYTALVTLLLSQSGEWEDTIRAFAAAVDGGQLDSSGAVLDYVEDGSALVGITLEETALKRIAAGSDIALVYPADGTSFVPDGSALVRGAPHEDNAKAFLDFTVSRDVQGLMASQYRRPVRTDVETSAELPEHETLAVLDYDVDWASGSRDAILMTWQFCLGVEEMP